MADEPIPFDRSIDAKPDEPAQLSPLVRRLIANNGGPFTFTGTCTYLVGTTEIAIIDPGPENTSHRDALLNLIGNAKVKAILVTHTHKDHSPGALALKSVTGAPILGPALPATAPSLDPMRAQVLDAGHDRGYAPDRVLTEGDRIEGNGYSLDVLATPGHTSNHLAFALAQESSLFSGDHVMAWSTTVVAPPDGSMHAYMRSLAKLQSRADAVLWPGHGGPVKEPQRFVRALAHHRRQRERAILARVKAGDGTADKIARVVYAGLAPALRGAASLSVEAHLIHLAEQDLIASDPQEGGTAFYRPKSFV